MSLGETTELTVSSIIEEKMMNEYWAEENKVNQNFQDEKKRIEKKHTLEWRPEKKKEEKRKK